MEREHMSLITELTRGKELTRQLKKNLHSSSHEKRVLVDKILSCYAQALSMLNCVEEHRHAISNMPNTPCSHVNGRQRNKFAVEDGGQNVSVKKRKTSASGKELVKLCTRTVVEGIDDGYRWRKYGQKEILGAKFRRGYYRCTHRKQGCLATKQVQKSDADPTKLEVTYQGSHTCNKLTNFIMRTPSKAKEASRQIEKRRQKPQIQETKKEQDMVSVTLFEGIQVETEDLTGRKNYEFPSFDFPSPLNEEEKIFPETTLGGNFMEGWSAMFMSPSSSASRSFSLSPFSVNDNGSTQILPITSESDITEIVSTPTSVNNYSPISRFDFSLDEVDLDTGLFFETPEFIC